MLYGVRLAESDEDVHYFGPRQAFPLISEHAGWFVSRLEVGHWLQAGDLVGYVYDGFTGELRAEAKTPVAGLLSGIRRQPLLCEGDLLARILTAHEVRRGGRDLPDGARSVAGGTMAIEEGKAAPDFTLHDQDGKPVSLSDFEGKQAVLLYFYPKDDTPGCTKEACGFRDEIRAFEKLGVAVLGVSPDAARLAPELHQEVQAALPAALGPQPQGDEALRRLRREDDVRQEDRRRDPIVGADREERQGAAALGAGGEGGGASGAGARGRAGAARVGGGSGRALLRLGAAA